MTLDINGGEFGLSIPIKRAVAPDTDLDADLYKLNLAGNINEDVTIFLPKITADGQWIACKQMEDNINACNLFVNAHAGDTIEHQPIGFLLDAGFFIGTYNSVFLTSELNPSLGISTWHRLAGCYSFPL